MTAAHNKLDFFQIGYRASAIRKIAFEFEQVISM
jgi:hypothetical protein